ncbi:MAG: hypothetical protein KAS32_01145 [Candidatus Peribacteraceae bacterium]|nr:hypothetical protein [Candidatus Peribacteraceae bacterium]
MAKNWTIEEDYMIRTYADEAVDTLDIALDKLFPEFEDLEKVQQACIVNGIKQKLDDSTARSKDMKLTEAEKRAVQEELWTRISVEKEWNMPKQTGSRGPTVSYKVIVPALEASGLDVEAIAVTLSTTVERVQPFISVTEKEE